MGDISLAELQTLRTISQTVRETAETPISLEEINENNLLARMAQIAASRLPKAQRSKVSETEVNSALIKDMVKWAVKQTDNKNPQQMIQDLREKILQYTLLVSIPVACDECLKNVPNSSAYANWLIYEILRVEGQRPTLDEKSSQQLTEFSKSWAKDPKVRQNRESFVRKVISHRDAWMQGTLGEISVFRLAQKANLAPEYAPVKQDIGPEHIDCFIIYKGQRIPVQIKSGQTPGLLEMKFVKAVDIKGQPTTKLLIRIGCPSILDPKNNEYFQQALYPDEQRAQEFIQLLEVALNQQNSSAHRSKYGNKN